MLEAIIFRGQVFLVQWHRPKGAGGEYSSKERKTFSTIILTNQRTILPCCGKHWSNLIQYIYIWIIIIHMTCNSEILTNPQNKLMEGLKRFPTCYKRCVALTTEHITDHMAFQTNDSCWQNALTDICSQAQLTIKVIAKCKHFTINWKLWKAISMLTHSY